MHPVNPARRLPAASWLLGAGGILAGALLLMLLAVPLLAVLLRVTPAVIFRKLGEPVVLEALRLSFITSGLATLIVVVLGLPCAYFLANVRFPGKRFVEVIVDLPMVLPPTVAGFALLLAFGRAGLLGRSLQLVGLTLPFSTLGVIVAQVFMAAPFFIAPARAGFAAVDRRYLEAAATLRATPQYSFFRVLLPLSLPALLAGAAMTWARALGEFGATITFAGNFPGVTQTMPLAVYVELQTDLDSAVALSALLLTMAFLLLLGLRYAPAGLFWFKPDAQRDSA